MVGAALATPQVRAELRASAYLVSHVSFSVPTLLGREALLVPVHVHAVARLATTGSLRAVSTR
jgi:hypothetical protein